MRNLSDPTLTQLCTLVEAQLEDDILFVAPENRQVELLQAHIRLLHEVIVGDLSVADALFELRQLAAT